MMHTEWLPYVVDGTYCEVLVFDAATLQLLYLNDTALKNLQYGIAMPSNIALCDMIADATAVERLLRMPGIAPGRITLDARLLRRDGSSYPVELRIIHCDRGAAPVFIAIGNDLSARRETAEALRFSETRFHAIVSNTPGLVYQFIQHQDGSFGFPYLSDGCHALLGITPDQLRADPSLFMSRVVEEDRPSLFESMSTSALEMKSWNWEGRVWIEDWNDIKWINLRATPRPLADGDVQWEGIMTNITQSKVSEAELIRSRAQLAELSTHVDKVKEAERTRISREIHDDLGGNLTAIKMALALLVRRIPGEDPALAEKAAYVDQLVDRTIDSVHRIAGDLRPGVLDFGIVEAILWQANEFERQLGIPCVVHSDVIELDLPPDHSNALFRIFQEALTNVGKHARAELVEVKLTATESEVKLEVADDGRGINPKDRFKPKSFGIRGMTERAIALGGTLRAYNAAGGGCVVAISMPLSPATRAAG